VDEIHQCSIDVVRPDVEIRPLAGWMNSTNLRSISQAPTSSAFVDFTHPTR